MPANLRWGGFDAPCKNFHDESACCRRSVRRCGLRAARECLRACAPVQSNHSAPLCIRLRNLIYNKPEDYQLKRDEVKDANMGVTCYLVPPEGHC